MRLGVNYTPRVGWFHSWLDFSTDDVRRDMDHIAGLGLDHVRIFPLWSILQPNRTLIRGIDDVISTVDAAHEAGLEVVVDGLQGHLSSYDFLPSWVSTWHDANLFTDPVVREGQRALVTALAERLADHPGAVGMSVGNEFIQFAAQRHPNTSQITPVEADDWLADLLGAISQQWPDGVHTHSYDDDLFFDVTHPFTPLQAINHGDVTTVHSWIFAHLGPKVGKDHPWLGWFARYLLELALAWDPGDSRQVWLQEVGAPSTHVSPAKAGEFTAATLANVADCERLWGVTWWCSHDVSRSLADFPELEYSLGLFDSEGNVKPAGRAIAEFAASHGGPAPNSVATQQRGSVQIIASSLREAQVASHPTGVVFEQWASRAENGDVARLVIDDAARTLTGQA